jgi:predicted phage terminase large subunit-like protein
MDLRSRLAALPPHKRARALARVRPEALLELRRLTESLLDFIPRVSPRLQAPRHLKPLIDLLQAAETEPVRATVSAPPQHGKSQACMHALIWMLRRNPAKRHGYATYEATFAEQQNEELQRIADRAGLKWTGNRTRWQTPQGGGVVAAGIGGPLTGKPIDGVLLVDDPVKNSVDANSSVMRERTDEWFKTVALTRVHPGASVIVVQTRWHSDDLSGRLAGRNWRRINLPAISDDGTALWPSGRSAEFLADVRRDVGEYIFASLYQGEPRPRGGSVFTDATLCEDVPKSGLRYSIGVDLAYTAKSQADYSVAIVLGRPPPAIDALGRPLEDAKAGKFYVVDVIRKQVAAPAFKKDLRTLARRYPGATMRWYAAGTEKGSADFMRQADLEGPGVALQVLAPRGDKFVRAQPLAAAWNAGRVLVPRGAAWAEVLVGELAEFTGNHDAHDDLIDAAAAGFDVLATPGPGALKNSISILG